MPKTLQNKTEPEKTNRRIPQNIAETWNKWCKTLNSKNPDKHICKGDFAAAAYLLLMDSKPKKISECLAKLSSISEKCKQVSVIVPKDISDKWLIWCSDFDQKSEINKGTFTAAAFDMLMKSEDDTVWNYLSIARQNQIETEDFFAVIALEIANTWDIWCENNIKKMEELNPNKGTLTAAAMTKFMDSSNKDTIKYLAAACTVIGKNKQIKATIPNYVKEQWLFWCGKRAFDIYKSNNEIFNKGTFLAAALTMLMDTKFSDVQKYISYSYSKDYYNYEIEVENRQEILELLGFALSGKMF